jgi:hypothetical protein
MPDRETYIQCSARQVNPSSPYISGDSPAIAEQKRECNERNDRTNRDQNDRTPEAVLFNVNFKWAGEETTTRPASSN